MNFDAYSFPDVAGWIVIGACIIIISVWFTEWFKNRKRKKFTVVASLFFVLPAMFFLISCTTKPSPFVSGQDECHVCKMGLADFRFGGEIITKKGKVYKFDDLRCMISYIKSGTMEEKDISITLTMNFNKPNEFIDVKKAWYLVSPEIRSPMSSNASGYISKEEAENILKGKTGQIVRWNDLLEGSN